MVFVAATAVGCGPSMTDSGDSEFDLQDPAVYVVVSDDIVSDVEQFLGPADDDNGSRVVTAAEQKTVLLLREHELEELSAFMHDKFHRCGGFSSHTSLDAATDALATFPAQDRSAVAVPLEIAEPEVVGQLIPLVDAGQILATISGLSSFPTRHYQSASGVDAAEWLRDQWAALAASRPGAVAELRPHSGWAQPSVTLTIPGDELPEEVIVVGGHLDSISFGGGSAPGADDDASGIATLTELARLIVSQDVRLRRTVIFMGYAAEEVGLRGSDEIAEEFAAQGTPVAGVLHFDMTNFDGSQHDLVLITDNTDPGQTDFLGQLATTYLPELPLSSDACGYACSDHASWTRAGFPAVFPFEATMDTYNPNIHTSGDTLSVSGNNADHAAKFAKLGIAYVVEMAEVPGGVVPVDPSVRLVQVAYDVPGLDRLGEFVDLTNTGDQTIDLSGWSLSNGTSSWAFPAGTTVAAGAFLTVATDAAGFGSLYGGAPDIAGVSILLNNSAGELILRDPAGTEMDYVGWERSGWPLSAATGRSILRSAPEDTGTAADWSVSQSPDPRGGS